MDAKFHTIPVGTEVRLRDGAKVCKGNAKLDEAGIGTVIAWTNAGFRGMEATVSTYWGNCYGIPAADLVRV